MTACGQVSKKLVSAVAAVVTAVVVTAAVIAAAPAAACTATLGLMYYGASYTAATTLANIGVATLMSVGIYGTADSIMDLLILKLRSWTLWPRETLLLLLKVWEYLENSFKNIFYFLTLSPKNNIEKKAKVCLKENR